LNCKTRSPFRIILENSPDFLEHMQQLIDEQLGGDDMLSDNSGDAGEPDGRGMEFTVAMVATMIGATTKMIR